MCIRDSYIGTGYGTELETHLIGRVYPKDYIRVEIGESVKTALLKHDNVTDVKDVYKRQT